MQGFCVLKIPYHLYLQRNKTQTSVKCRNKNTHWVTGKLMYTSVNIRRNEFNYIDI